MNDKMLVSGSSVVTKSEAKRILKENDNKVSNGEVDAFVSLKDINKIYPNGVQAVYDFNIDIDEHDFIVLVGPSGCGKSTTLRMVAGLEDITSGYLYINKVLSNYLASKDRDISMVFQSYALYPQMTVYDNIAFPLKIRKYKKIKKAELVEALDHVIKALDDPDEVLGAIVDSKDKNLRFGNAVEYLATRLHISDIASKEILLACKNVVSVAELLDVKDQIIEKARVKADRERTKLEVQENCTINEAYEVLKDGVKIEYLAKLTKSEIREKVFEAARILDLGPYLDRRPKELSGGQMQRVALGRAIVRNARLFLMDEPLSNLDAKLRVQMRSEIVRIHEQIGATTIYVTHDQTEAMTMATKIAVMSKGWVQQIGTPETIYNDPRNIFVATFIGAPAMNIINGVYYNGVVTLKDGYTLKLKPEFKKLHDDFYKTRIEDCKRMLQLDDFKKMHALLEYDEVVKLEGEELIAGINRLIRITSTISDENGVAATSYLSSLIEASMAVNENGQPVFLKHHEIMKTLNEVRRELLQIHNISSADLGKLHNAQAFSEKDSKKKEEVFYAKRKHKEKKNKHSTHFRVNNLTFTNNLYQVCVNLLESYEKALIGAHDIKIGIRPENIHLENEFTGKKKSEPFTIVSDVVELMGSELLIHSEWNGVDLISKISTGTLVKPHTNVDLVLDMDKVLLFDVNCGDTIK